MTTVDFYILSDSKDDALTQTAIRLIEKAYKAKKSVYIHLSDNVALKKLDTLLWTYKDISFIPHSANIENDPFEKPIHLGLGNIPSNSYEICFNLTQEPIKNLEPFERLIEIVPNDKEQKQLARGRYSHYRQLGATLKSHDITSKN